ncbi:MAG TPA: MCE family protein [Dysgonomonas sp.]|nr:MCE family protein [Dysgonomonas sp.]
MKITKEVKIGIAFILALIILYVGINFLKGVNIFKPTNSYIVVFDNVSGLTLSTPVLLNGYQVGLVSSMELDVNNNNRINVEINLNKGVRVPKGSILKLDVSIMGSGYLILQQPQTVTDYYASGDKIPGVRNKGALEAVSSVLPDAKNLLPKVDSILTSVQVLMSNPALNQSIDNMGVITTELARTSREINGLLAQLKRDLPRLTEDVTTITGNLATTTDQLKTVDIEATYRSIDATLKNIEQLSTKLNSNDNSLGLLLNDKSLHDSLSMTLGNASLLLQDVRENPSKYINVRVF